MRKRARRSFPSCGIPVRFNEQQGVFNLAFFCGEGFCLPLGKHTYTMGILNVTPDSFSDGGRWVDPELAAAHAIEMQAQGAALLDIGAQSTRPGHVAISAEEELFRLTPVLERLKGVLRIPVSVDTYFPQVARSVLAQGAQIINDVSGVFSEEMARVIREYGAGWIVMHTGGGTADTQEVYPAGVTAHVRAFFETMEQKALAFGIAEQALCFDPGIGFGKTCEENLTLLRNVNQLRLPGRALLVGASRKRVVGQATGVVRAQDRVIGTVAAHVAAIAGGCDILRVHDVLECVESAKMADAIYRRTVEKDGEADG